jgi:hypothetical protein
MRTFDTFLAVGILALAAGCGGSDNKSTSGRTFSNGGQCPASSSGEVCTGEDAYNTCELNACGTEYKACFGNNFASGDFAGGVCADFFACEMKCPCDATATTCEETCTTQYLTTAAGATCAACVTTLSTCVTTGAGATCTNPVCTTTSTNTNTNTNTDTSTSTGCAGALACCTALGTTYGATVTTQCQTALAGQTDATCDQVVSAYKAAGICP